MYHQAMPFADESFDFLLANHVLEHVDSPDKALTEIHRVLKRGGHAILQTPYSPRLHGTLQVAGIDTPEARLHAYGQEDHARLFGRDIFEFIAAFGLEPCIHGHDELLVDHDADTYGVNPLEPFFLFRRSD